ncbi:hypothetical protein NX059_000776 [Plenodomus lindquistii]|nr:hypothetical protein NX059_000776 [Plenodomus lindquistii]
MKPSHTATQSRSSGGKLLLLPPRLPQAATAASDGFVGSELYLSTTQTPARRKGPSIQKSKKRSAMRILPLRRGPVPEIPALALAITAKLPANQERTESSVVSNVAGVLASDIPTYHAESTRPRH